MRIHAVIPARGGSKGIKHKNLCTVGGVSLLARCISAARGAEGVNRVLVSTDSPDIKSAALAAGAEAVDRPALLGSDTASSESVLLHVLDGLEESGDLPDILLFLQCTSPFTRSADIDRAVRLVTAGEADVAFAAVPFHGFVWKSDAKGLALGVNHDPAVRPRRQDRMAEWVETGAFYALRVAGFRAARHRFFGMARIVEVPPEQALDIDEPADLVIANAFAATHFPAET